MSFSDHLLNKMLADGLSREEAERELAEIAEQLSSMPEEQLRQLERASSMSEDQLRRGEHLKETESADGEFVAVFGDLDVPPTSEELRQLWHELGIPKGFIEYAQNQCLGRMVKAARRREERLGLVSEPYRPGDLDNERRHLLETAMATALGLPVPKAPRRTVEDALTVLFEAARIVDSDTSFEERRAQLQELQEANPDVDLSGEVGILAKLQSDQEDET